jgi:hypothetical protein
MTRPEVTGRSSHNPGSRPTDPYSARGPPVAYTIPEFCAAHRISRAQYYVLRNKGLGPDETRLLGKVIITEESAARWRKRHTARARSRVSGGETAVP